MPQFEKGTYEGVVVKEGAPGDVTVLCVDCLAEEEKAYEIEEVLIQEVLEEGGLFVCDKCLREIRWVELV
jgi:hypothetical protein